MEDNNEYNYLDRKMMDKMSTPVLQEQFKALYRELHGVEEINHGLVPTSRDGLYGQINFGQKNLREKKAREKAKLEESK